MAWLASRCFKHCTYSNIPRKSKQRRPDSGKRSPCCLLVSLPRAPSKLAGKAKLGASMESLPTSSGSGRAPLRGEGQRPNAGASPEIPRGQVQEYSWNKRHEFSSRYRQLLR